jgi:hypothetical protein
MTMIGFPTGAPVTTDPESALTLARIVLAGGTVVMLTWYRFWSRIIDCTPGQLKRRIEDLLRE